MLKTVLVLAMLGTTLGLSAQAQTSSAGSAAGASSSPAAKSSPTAPPASSSRAAAPAAASATSAATPSSAPAAIPPQGLASNQFSSEQAAKSHCPGEAVVWVNLTGSKVYHGAADRYFGKTKHGAFMCQKEADQAGYHAAGAGGSKDARQPQGDNQVRAASRLA